MTRFNFISPIRSILTLLLVGGWAVCAFAQHGEEGQEGEEELLRHRVGVTFGYAHVPEGKDEAGGDKGIFVPSLGVGYQYRLNERWAVGGVAEVELANYVILDRDLDRKAAVIVAAEAYYEALPRWNVFGGAGVEIEEHESFYLLRLGTEYEFPLAETSDITPVFTFDHKDEYNTWALSVAVGRRF